MSEGTDDARTESTGVARRGDGAGSRRRVVPALLVLLMTAAVCLVTLCALPLVNDLLFGEYAGEWAGQTSDGRQLVLHVGNGVVTGFTVARTTDPNEQVSVWECWAFLETGVPIAADGSFSGVVSGIELQGRFGPGGRVRGTYLAGGSTRHWSARRRALLLGAD